jgi:hypothetical protein
MTSSSYSLSSHANAFRRTEVRGLGCRNLLKEIMDKYLSVESLKLKERLINHATIAPHLSIVVEDELNDHTRQTSNFCRRLVRSSDVCWW